MLRFINFSLILIVIFTFNAFTFTAPDSCLKLIDYNGSDTTFTNLDSIKVDSCLGSPTYLGQYAKKFFDIEFEYNIIPKDSLYPKDTIIEYDWSDIDSTYLSTLLSFHQYAIDNYGIGGQVSREKILTDIQREVNVDYDGAETLLLLMVGVNYFKELNNSLIVASKTGEYFDNSLIKYWLTR